MTPGGEPITRCPVCRYDLTGLPKNHRCPECGFEYDETMRVWFGRKMPRWRVALSLTTFGAMGAFPFVMVAYTWIVRGTLPVLPLRMQIASLLLVLSILPFVVIAITARHRAAFIIIADNGLYMRTLIGRLRKFSWDEISVRGWLAERPSEHEGHPAATVGRFREFMRRRWAGTWFDFRMVRTKERGGRKTQ